jgi:NTP pyrophosphatase (non-canonical NTP hydrolase)
VRRGTAGSARSAFTPLTSYFSLFTSHSLLLNPSPPMSLADAQRRVDTWITQFEEGYFDPLTNLARLAEEVGELAREVNHRFGQKTKKKDEAEGDPGMEMADILFVIICMANREGIDLDDAFNRMMQKVEARDARRWTRKSVNGER